MGSRWPGRWHPDPGAVLCLAAPGRAGTLGSWAGQGRRGQATAGTPEALSPANTSRATLTEHLTLRRGPSHLAEAAWPPHASGRPTSASSAALSRGTAAWSQELSDHPCPLLQRGLEEYSLSLHPGASGPFRRHSKRLKSNLKSADCSKTVAGHLSS